jgi:hypothetical protein
MRLGGEKSFAGMKKNWRKIILLDFFDKMKHRGVTETLSNEQVLMS